jgi:hypothetical protein
MCVTKLVGGLIVHKNLEAQKPKGKVDGKKTLQILHVILIKVVLEAP